MLEVTNDTDVYTARDEHVGSVDRIVMDPATQRMTHVVVRKGLFLPEDKLIAVEDISTATPQRVNLRQDVSPDDLLPFVEQHYVPLDEADRLPEPDGEYRGMALAWYGPVGDTAPLPPETVTAVNERNIPDRLAAVEVGIPVFASDREDVGRLDRVITDDSGFPSYIVVNDGGLRPESRAVPIAWVEDIAENVILLAARSRMVRAIPPLGPDQ